MMLMRFIVCVVVMLGCVRAQAADTPVTGDNWPQFRGPTGQGLSPEKNLPLQWGGPTNENVLWKSPLIGSGHASPIVWGDAVIVCTVKWPGDGAPDAAVIPEHHVACYRVKNGELMWNTVVSPGPWVRKDFRSGAGGGYAGPTPATDGTLIYAAFGSSVLATLDFTGKIVWRKDIVPFSFDVTLGSSPILFKDTVIFLCAMAKSADSCVIAFDKSSGDIKWQKRFPDMSFAHSTPLMISVKEQPQLLVLASGGGEKTNALRGLNPSTGEMLWFCKGQGDAASPVFGDGIVYFDSGRGGKGVAVDPSGSGDVSATHVKWGIPPMEESISSPTLLGGYLYRLNRLSVLRCYETATGNQKYFEKLPGISSKWASPILDGNGRLYFANAGKSYVIQTGPEFKILGTSDLEDGNDPSPAVANGKLFLVGKKNIYCVGSGR